MPIPLKEGIQPYIQEPLIKDLFQMVHWRGWNVYISVGNRAGAANDRLLMA